MGLFSALAGVVGGIGSSIGSFVQAGIGVGTQALTGIVAPALQAVGGIIPGLLGGLTSSGAPGAQVTAPQQQAGGYYIPPYAGGPNLQQLLQQYGAAGPAAFPGAGLAGGPPVGPAQFSLGTQPGTTFTGRLGAELTETAAGQLASPWKATCGGSSLGAQNHIQVNPATGAIRWFGPKGKPILWSDDLAACKRVKRVASRAGKVLRKSGGRY